MRGASAHRNARSACRNRGECRHAASRRYACGYDGSTSQCCVAGGIETALRRRGSAYLVLKTVESTVAERALVRTRNLALVHVERGVRQSLDGGVVGVETTGDGVGDGGGERGKRILLGRRNGRRLLRHGGRWGDEEGTGGYNK